MDENDKLNPNEVEDVSGGMYLGKGRALSGCRYYVCNRCGAPAENWTYFGDTCLSLTVNHQPGCAVPKEPKYIKGTIKECCFNCMHSFGNMTCDVVEG